MKSSRFGLTPGTSSTLTAHWLSDCLRAWREPAPVSPSHILQELFPKTIVRRLSTFGTGAHTLGRSISTQVGGSGHTGVFNLEATCGEQNHLHWVSDCLPSMESGNAPSYSTSTDNGNSPSNLTQRESGNVSAHSRSTGSGNASSYLPSTGSGNAASYLPSTGSGNATSCTLRRHRHLYMILFFFSLFTVRHI